MRASAVADTPHQNSTESINDGEVSTRLAVIERIRGYTALEIERKEEEEEEEEEEEKGGDGVKGLECCKLNPRP